MQQSPGGLLKRYSGSGQCVNQQYERRKTGQNEPSGQTEESEEPEETNGDINETLLVDEAGIKITAQSLSMDGFWGPELKLLIENNSGKNLTFQCRNASINGYMIDASMSADVVDGKKANDAITFMDTALELCGITAIADIEFSFHIFTTEDWEPYLDTSMFQLKTPIADSYEYTFDDSGDLAYNGNDVKIIIKGLTEDDSIFGPSIRVYIENNNESNITVQTRDVSINGVMVDAVFSADVVSGKHAIDSITFMSSDLEENGITEIETIELSFHLFETDSWDTTIADTDPITITF